MELIIAVIGGIAGGLVAQVGEYLRHRHLRHERWLEPTREAAAAVVAYYGSARDQLLTTSRTGQSVAPFDEFFADRAAVFARLLTLPGADVFRPPLKGMSKAFVEFRASIESGDPEDVIRGRRTETLATIRTFEAAVRDYLASR